MLIKLVAGLAVCIALLMVAAWILRRGRAKGSASNGYSSLFDAGATGGGEDHFHHHGGGGDHGVFGGFDGGHGGGDASGGGH
jgi:hypothetical protein